MLRTAANAAVLRATHACECRAAESMRRATEGDVSEQGDSRFQIYGVLHLQPLPGAPRFGGSFAAVQERALQDASALLEGNVDGLIVENFGDVPFYPGQVPAETVAAMAILVRAVCALAPERPVGVNVLRNDARSALAIAAAAGARFVRINVHQGAAVTDQGLLQGQAHESVRERARLAPDVKLFCDVRVKHAAPLGERALDVETADLVLRGLADAVLVTGVGTGRPVRAEDLRQVAEAAALVPVWIASGFDVDQVEELMPHAQGAIVGTAFEEGGVPGAPVDRSRVERLLDAVAKVRG